LLTLRLKTTAAFTSGNSIRISLAADPLNELADEKYDVLGRAVISTDIIDATALGIDEQFSGNVIRMNCYPNPFGKLTTVTYTLPFDGMTTLEVSNLMGNKVASLVSEIQGSGTYKVNFNSENLPEGMYSASLRLKSADNEVFQTIKLIINR
jgi:hypothetical protein